MSTAPSDEALPEGSVVDGERITRSIDDSFDFVVIGSGAAGSVAAHTLASAGYAVGIVEEGPWIKTREITSDVHGTFARAMRLSGMQVLQGRAYMPMLQGRCVGGSTFVNSAIAWRIPEDVLEEWQLPLSMRDLDPHFTALERDLHVTEVAPAVLGENNRLFIEAFRKKGVAAAPMRRYERSCKGSGHCLTGCANGAKQGMSITYVPWALDKGARIFTSCRVEHIEVVGDRARSVRARSTAGHYVTLRARHAVIVAASTVQTPNILRRSGVSHPALGKHFQAHPGLAVGGLFDRRIDMTFGATQGAESLHYRRSDRLKLETIALPPDVAGARVPGVGRELAERLAQLGNMACWSTVVRARAEGTVKEGFGGVDRVTFTMSEEDLRDLRKGAAILARTMFEAGAREVWPGIHGVPSVLRSIDDVRLIDEAPLEPRSYNCIATHLFGAASMGTDARASVVAPDFSVRGVAGLYVVDSSVFPTNLGVNPQHTIMALSRLAATRLADRACVRSRPGIHRFSGISPL